MENSILNQVKNELTELGKSVGEIGKLRLIGIISRVLGLFLLILTVMLCVLALFTFGAVAAIDAMSACMPVWAAALIISSAYIVLMVLAILCRRPLFINPFIKLLSKQIKSEEELALKIMEAEHKVELQHMRMRGQVENVTREVNFYAGLITRAWRAIKRLFQLKDGKK